MSVKAVNRGANTLLGTSLIGLAIGLWAMSTKVDISTGFWSIIAILGVLAAIALCFAMLVPFRHKLDLAICIASLIACFAVGNYVLKATGRDLVAIIDAKVVRHVMGSNKTAVNSAGVEDWVSARPVDPRTGTELHDALTAAGIPHNPMYNPVGYLALIDTNKIPPYYPLSSAPNAVTVGCNEGDQRDFPIWHTDRYGYNNDDTVYAFKNLIFFVGGSFAQGSCVHQDETIGGVLRRHGYPAVNLGIGGFGQIAALATLKEYGERLKPKIVLWQFFDPNDISLLTQWDLRSRFLLQYLKDEFSQDLIDQQDRLIEFWNNHGQWAAVYKEFFDSENSPALQSAWEKRLDDNLPLIRELLGADIGSLRDDDGILKVYEKVFEIAKRRVASWGGRIYLVVIPNMDVYRGRVPKYQSAIVKIMQKLGISTIDADDAIRRDPDPFRFFAQPKGWSHFNQLGYRITARQIAAKLEADYFSSASSQSIAAHRD
jgi:hypothetical protein